MKANAPEKLYIFNPEKREVWFSKTSDKQVEYTRTDAFVEKACSWFRRIDNDDSMPPFETTEEFIKEFRNYMKGE